MPRKQKTIEVNGEGLTQGEWLAAVGQVPVMDLRKMEDCWRRGEDPAEWRNYYQTLEAARLRAKAARA
jgi:hypothetical protein